MKRTIFLAIMAIGISCQAFAQGKFFGGDGGGGAAVELQSIALPVELISFSGTRNGAEIELKWQTAVEIGQNVFHIQTANDDGHFSTIGQVEALNLLTGSEYEFNFATAQKNEVVYCRLKMVDEKGEEFSKVLSFAQNGLSTPSLFPNPSHGNFRVAVENEASQFELRNAAGQLVHQERILANSKELQVKVSYLPKGTYYFVLLKNSGERCKAVPVYIH